MVRILAFFKLFTWILLMITADSQGHSAFAELLYFDLAAIYSGEVWRALSFLILPGSNSVIFIIFEVIFLFMIGDSLERAWGPFGVTLYYFSGVFLGLLACVLLSLKIHYPGFRSNYAVYAALIMAAGFLYPDTIIQLYLIIPVKLVWIGILSGLGVLWTVFSYAGQGLVPFLGLGIPQLACLLPFCVVFIPRFIRGAQHRSKVAARRGKFEGSKLPESEAFHRCDRCSATDVSHPEREFRINAEGEEMCNACRDETT